MTGTLLLRLVVAGRHHQTANAQSSIILRVSDEVLWDGCPQSVLWHSQEEAILQHFLEFLVR